MVRFQVFWVIHSIISTVIPLIQKNYGIQLRRSTEKRMLEREVHRRRVLWFQNGGRKTYPWRSSSKPNSDYKDHCSGNSCQWNGAGSSAYRQASTSWSDFHITLKIRGRQWHLRTWWCQYKSRRNIGAKTNLYKSSQIPRCKVKPILSLLKKQTIW